MKLAIKSLLVVLLFITLSGAVSAAESKYVSEEFEITMRTGPGTDRKIIALIPSGRAVEILEAGEEWSQVRLSNGKEGWVLSRYLTDTVPTAIKLERLEAKYAEAIEKSKALEVRASNSASENENLSKELKETQDALKQLQAQYETLKRDSADFIKFKATYEKNQKELIAMREKADNLDKENNRLVSNQLIQGGLYGGGLVIIGFIAGFILKKPKRKSGLL